MSAGLMDPPQADAVVESELHPDQLLAGIARSYKRFKRMEKAYRKINGAATQTQPLPLATIPTGDDEPIELDWADLIGSCETPDEADQLILQTLGPWNNYFANKYTDQLRDLARFTQNAFTTFSGQALGEQVTTLSFDDCVEQIHREFALFQQLQEQYSPLSQTSDRENVVLTFVGTSPSVGETRNPLLEFTLRELLDWAGISDGPARERIVQNLFEQRTHMYQERLIPCLENLARASGRAITFIDQKQAGMPAALSAA